MHKVLLYALDTWNYFRRISVCGIGHVDILTVITTLWLTKNVKLITTLATYQIFIILIILE